MDEAFARYLRQYVLSFGFSFGSMKKLSWEKSLRQAASPIKPSGFRSQEHRSPGLPYSR